MGCIGLRACRTDLHCFTLFMIHTSTLLLPAGLVSSLPYLAQLIVETGLVNASVAFLQQLLCGSVAFAIFRMQVRHEEEREGGGGACRCIPHMYSCLGRLGGEPLG